MVERPRTPPRPAPATHGSFRTVRASLEDDRHRAVVHELERHARAEAACGDVDALLPKRGTERLVERLGLLRRRRVAEARPVAPGRIYSYADDNARMPP